VPDHSALVVGIERALAREYILVKAIADP